MNDSIKRISLDLHNTSSRETVKVKRGDTGRKIYVSLVDGGRPYSISKDCTAVFTGKKPDGHVVYNDCTIEGNVIIYKLTDQTSAVPGLVNCEIKLYGADAQLITSSKFSIMVEDTVYNEGDEIESTDEFLTLARLVGEAVEAVSKANTAADNAESAAQLLQYFEGKYENLLDVSAITDDAWIKDDTGEIITGVGTSLSDFIPVSEGQVITCQQIDPAGNRNTGQMVFVSEYNSNKEILRTVGTLIRKHEIPSGVSYVRITLFGDLEQAINEEYTVVATEVITNYAPFGEFTFYELKPQTPNKEYIESLVDERVPKDLIRFTEQDLTEDQQAQARENIGAADANDLYVKTEINVSEHPSYNVIIGSSTNKWGSGTNRATNIVPVDASVKQIDVKANSNYNSVIALLQSDAHESGTAPDYATGGYRMAIDPGETVTISVPNDCHYIAIMSLFSGADYSPSSVVFHGTANLEQMQQDIKDNKTAIGENAKQIKKNTEDVTALNDVLFPKIEIDLSTQPSFKTIIAISTDTWGAGTDRETFFVPVGNALQIDVTANDDANSIVALLKTNAHVNGTTPDYATGGYRMTILAGETANLSVPDDCNYIAIMGVAKGVDYAPASVVFHTQLQANTADSTPPIGLHTMPENEGVLNCIKRCRQLTDIKWTPLFDLPRWSCVTGGHDSDGDNDVREDVFKAGVEYTGLPYARGSHGTDHSSSDYGYSNFFTGFNVPFSAFMTAIREPNSIMKESVFSLTYKSAAVYGIVCSTLACYAYGLSYRGTSTLQNVSGMEKISDVVVDGVNMDASLIKLGDMILYSGFHVGVITDIVTDANGNVIAIEVSEATIRGNGNLARQGTQFGGLTIRKGWFMDEFFSHWKNYSIYRYANINSITYTPSAYVNVGDELSMMPQIDYACLPYMGEGFKYKVGKIPNSTIVIGVEGYNYLRVMKDGEYFGDPIAINGETYVDAGFTEVGSYSAYLCNMDGDTETKTTGSCHWSVV